MDLERVPECNFSAVSEATVSEHEFSKPPHLHADILKVNLLRGQRDDFSLSHSYALNLQKKNIPDLNFFL